MIPEGYYNPGTGNYYYYLRDHLGNNRITYHYSGSAPVIDQEVEYYPFGSMFAANNLQNNLYLYNGKELNNEFFENYDYGARMYDPQIGRFHTQDRFAEKYMSYSPYQYSLNNPISYIDINGDSAWTINKSWNKDFIAKYQTSVQNTIRQYEKDGKKFTCEDLALSVMMDFAEKNGLPVTITNGSGTYDARSDKYTDAETFKNDVLTSTAAPDLQNNQNTSTIGSSQATSGDIILNRNQAGIPTHAQVVTSPENNMGVMGIKQGNSGAMNIVPGASRVFGAGNPNSAFYTGKPIESAIYVPAANFYKNYTTGKTITNYSTAKNIVFKRFNFNNF